MLKKFSTVMSMREMNISVLIHPATIVIITHRNT